jgi:cysteine desulfuration protein SufE
VAQAEFDDIAGTFEFLDDWEDRYRYVIDLGRKMPPMEDALKVPATKVEGCASQVWIVPRIQSGRFDFAGDSDALIVRGLIAVLRAYYAGRTPGRCWPRSTSQAALGKARAGSTSVGAALERSARHGRAPARHRGRRVTGASDCLYPPARGSAHGVGVRNERMQGMDRSSLTASGRARLADGRWRDRHHPVQPTPGPTSS